MTNTTPPPPAGPPRPPTPADLAEFWPRAGAFAIDALLVVLASGLVVLGVAYLIGMWTWRGQTLGQVLFNIKVVRADGSPVDLRTATLRTVGYVACMFTLGIGFLAASWDERRQGLHDKIAETYVVVAAPAR